MREYTTILRCDICSGEATHLGFRLTSGEQRSDGSGFRPRVPREIDLCDEDYDRLVQPLLDAMQEYGINVNKPAKERQRGWKRAVGPYQCQVPGCRASKPLRTGETLAVHLRKQHQLTLDEYMEQYGPLEKLAS